ncbi:cysteine-rich secretory protein LCCL domain-containing 2 [Latimeria chalumnae]|uniref:Cysteine rich secretory protein LCCL domain containing 2 n=1 Tax=Latimeria chalumnae TaxID=7897 RepID=M3XH67_LATCH|nr:PREDICTED: cysteine-rich secretory protein LCCL domain-containing 2 [Latimeria chalumnae]|eukprot:XP_006010300.1 PREDICTED: cysteine-rich secretory protein LCCL domain-containing 2 [Latimeria chalumnae]
MSPAPSWIISVGLMFLAHEAWCFFLPNATHLESLLSKYTDQRPHYRSKRSISRADKEEILQLHNKLRGEVYPSSSNMEFMNWDDELEKSAEAWAQECIWEHGPSALLPSIGQNLAVHWGRYRSPPFHVQAWYDEVKDYTFPYPHECNPWCPEKCSGPMCTHYTQIVWATTNKVGCAVNVCRQMNVWGEIWEDAVYLVCNYAPKGNWIGEAPYKHGRSCSACPPSYGGSCKQNLCYKADDYAVQQPETDEANEVEKFQKENQVWEPSKPKTPKPKETKPKETTTSTHMTQVIKCETKMRDRCKGSTCNRYKCPAGCKNSKPKAKVFGTLFYDAMSSICRAAIHYGIIDDNGGLVDITRNGKLPFFIRSTRNGIESLSKYKRANSFMVSKVTEHTADCYTTVAELCPFRKPATHCPRLYCPANCRDEPSYWAPVIGTNVYADSSSICRAAVHAGVIKDEIGGYVDVMPVDKKKNYVSSSKNGITSESKKNPSDGKAFRIFAVKA